MIKLSQVISGFHALTSPLEALVSEINLLSLNTKTRCFFASPLRGEADFQDEQKPASARKPSEGECNKYALFHPHLEFLKLVPRFEIHPSPLKGEGCERLMNFFLSDYKEILVVRL